MRNMKTQSHVYMIQMIASIIPTIENKSDSFSRQFMIELEGFLDCDECDIEYLFKIKNKIALLAYNTYLCNIIMSKIVIMCNIYKHDLDISDYNNLYTRDELIYILTDLIPILLGDIEYDESIFSTGEDNIKNFLRSRITMAKGFGTNNTLNIFKNYKNDNNAMTLLN